MRENRLYGSEGGEVKSLPYPYQGPPHCPAGFGAASRSHWIASSQGLLAMTENGYFSLAKRPSNPRAA